MFHKILIIIFLMAASAVYAQEEDCYAYESFGESFPLSKDNLKMIEELNEAIKGIQSPKGSYDKKVAFFQSILPDIVNSLSSVEKERRDMLEILNKKAPTEADLKKLEALKARYDAKTNEELKLKVNIIPIDLILVQSAIESGWGGSNAAKNCNNLFGLHALGGLSVCDTPSKKIAKFTDKKQSLDAYILSINKNNAYKDFRNKRAEILKKRQNFTGVELAPYLLKYSTRGKDYTDEVRHSIQNHRLDDIITSALQISESCEFPEPVN